MKIKPIDSGIVAVASPIPMFILTVLWSWIWILLIGIGILNYNTIPDWLMTVSLLPLSISPAFCVAGIIHGIVKMKEKHTWTGIGLSIAGLIENFVLIFGMGYLGSRF